jgi:hypothetical protein
MARPMIAGESANHDAAAVDVVMNRRRLTGPIVMALSPRHHFFCAAIVAAAVYAGTVRSKRRRRQGCHLFKGRLHDPAG